MINKKNTFYNKPRMFPNINLTYGLHYYSVLYYVNEVLRIYACVEIEGKQVATVKVKVDFVVLTIPFVGTNNIILFG